MSSIIVLVVVVAMTLSFSTIMAQDLPKGVKPLMQQPLTMPALDIVASTVEIVLGPGDPGSPPHVHPGPVVGYVVEGEFMQQLEGEPHKILKAGSAFYELDGAKHIWGGNGNNHTVCKVVATALGRPGQPIVTPLLGYKLAESYEEALKLAWANFNNNNNN